MRFLQQSAAVGRSRMNRDYGLASIELLHHRLERGVPQPSVAITSEQCDAVGLECVVRVCNLVKRGVDIR